MEVWYKWRGQLSGRDEKWRCLAMHNSVENIHQSESYSRLRSLLIFGVVDPLSKSSISMFLSSRLLKVLDLRGARLEKIPSLVFTLIHLRYLSMRGTNVRQAATELGATKLGTTEQGTTELRTVELGITELRTVELRATELG
ncbi:hypothetical protein RJ640_027051 [Escallonia rubra]|uniref:Uncharacterized protein n=1 Tax=Escallonia rubra TaxID=112253 RepID=A0AA88RXM5_9ASTE|nr:hypothetical protein RJ640_027051 [Escallonia rubra]